MGNALDSLPQSQQLYLLLAEEQRRVKTNKIVQYYPTEGALCRGNYPKHLSFFRAGTAYRERLFLAANRVGKSEGVGGYELTLHLTGEYPDWWDGRRYDRPVNAWAAGDTGKTVRDILQYKLLGPVGSFGTGLIPERDIEGRPVSKPGVADAVEIVRVKHVSGGISVLTFKSYDQGREAFQGTEQDVIWLDEEPPLSVYTECLVRTMTINGMILCTFTPLLGLSSVVLHYLPDGKMPVEETGRFVVMATWDDAPHLEEQEKAELWSSFPPYQRDARTKGVPQLGSGAIYPVPESEIVVKPFQLPDHWQKGYGFDVGWNKTAAIWGAVDRESDVLYLFSEHYQGQAEPAIHAAAIKARGDVPGFIDPSARGRNQMDGKQLLIQYEDLGLDLAEADNAVEAGIYAVWMRLSTGRLKVFETLNNWLSEYRIYRRDENGKVVKKNDHLMDGTRYLILSGLDLMVVKTKVVLPSYGSEMGWML